MPLGATAKAWFHTETTDIQSADKKRSWELLTVGYANETIVGTDVKTIVARNEEDVWLLSRGAHGDAIWHSGPFREPVTIAYGEPVEARNESAPTSWSGHCDQIFVVLAEAKVEKKLDAMGFDRNKVQETLGSRPKAYTWTLVQGRLFDTFVIGVVFSHQYPSFPIEEMEQKASALVEAFAKNPVDRPRATCTLPVLSRSLF